MTLNLFMSTCLNLDRPDKLDQPAYCTTERIGKKEKKLSYSGKTAKIEKILKGGLDSIPSPSPSVKIQIMGGKVCLSCKDKKKNIAGYCQKTFSNFVWL